MSNRILPPDTEHFTCIRVLEMPHLLVYNLDPKPDPAEKPKPLKPLSPEAMLRDMLHHKHVYVWRDFMVGVQPLFTPLELKKMQDAAKAIEKDKVQLPTRPIFCWKPKHLLLMSDALIHCPRQDKLVPWQYLPELMFGRPDEEGNKIIPKTSAGSVLVMGGSKERLVGNNIKVDGPFYHLVHAGYYSASTEKQWNLKEAEAFPGELCDMETLFLTGE